MTRRPSVDQIRGWLLDGYLDDDWQTPTELGRRLGLGHGIEHLKLALVLERLVNDGHAELKTPGSRTRRFRLREGHP